MDAKTALSSAGDPLTRVQRHLVVAHNFVEDSWRVREAPNLEHDRDHTIGSFMHDAYDLYTYLEEEV